MITLVIPGYATKNKDWGEETAKKVKGEPWSWPHWTNPEDKFNPQKEAEKIKEKVGDSEVNIIAKSIGTYVTMLLLKKIKPKKLILCGICYNDLNENELSEYKILSDMDPAKVLVFQNSTDEHGSFEKVRRFLSEINPNIKIIEKPGSTHDYPYYDEFIEFLDQE